MSCERFHDDLAPWMRGDLDEAETRALLEHASHCADCAAVLRIEEQLALGSTEELEGAVPEELVRTVWPGVAAALSTRRERRPQASAPLHRRMLVPALAASLAVLLTLSGFLLGRLTELNRARPALKTEVTFPPAQLDLTARPEIQVLEPERTASRPPLRLPREATSLDAVRSWLRQLPPDTVLLSGQETRLVMAGVSPGLGFLRQTRAIQIDPDDGVDARELLDLLETLDRGAERRIAERWLRDLTARSRGRI